MALHRRHLHHLRRRPLEIPLAAPLAPVLPRARQGHLCTRRELLYRSPLLTCPLTHRSPRFRGVRDLTGAGLVAVVVLVRLRPN